ncbi:hypothetical protein MKY84_13495 [Chryseomicrobium sp. FSL W7-1435]|uniref:hypothetical protein n=1 Tax=Chryseomicrobium sp. FSL W7-1435 TaxID=2921704 RepID=UPI003159E2E9
MSKYIIKFFLVLIINIILTFVLMGIFDGGDYVETWVVTFSTIIILLLSFLIALMFYVIDLIKKISK